MTNRNWNPENEQALDAMLQKSLSELPLPDDVVKEVTPWRGAMNRILTGLALNLITLNFLNLNFILPTIGLLLLLLGFRALRRENGWFKGCYILTILRLAYVLPTLVLNATVYQSAFYASPMIPTLTALNLALIFLLIFCFWQGLRAVQKKSGLPVGAGGAAALMVWCVLIWLLALTNYEGLFLGLVFVLIYILILRGLFKLSGKLDEAGYVIRPAPVRVPDRMLTAVILVCLAVGMTCAYLFLNRFPMEWQPQSVTEDAETAEIKEQLISLGFPEDVLADLTEDDVRSCQGALQVVVNVDVMDVSNEFTHSPEQGLRFTGVAVQLPEEQQKWKIFHHFQWTGNPTFCGTEAILLWPYNASYSSDWTKTTVQAPYSGEITGQVLYDKDGQVYAAPFYSLEAELYSSSFFSGASVCTDIFASFSLPRSGENQRGYVSYTFSALTDNTLIYSWVNYTHQKHLFQYPVRTAREERIASSAASAFFTIQEESLWFNSIGGTVTNP